MKIHFVFFRKRWNSQYSKKCTVLSDLTFSLCAYFWYFLILPVYSWNPKHNINAFHHHQLIRSRLSATSEDVQFLGFGKSAIVRNGVVLIAPPDEGHHFLHDAAIFIYAMGIDDSNKYVIRGAILDQPTPFTIGEMADDAIQPRRLHENLLFRGGEFGGDTAFMLHADPFLGELAQNEMIGSSGIFQGGLDYALASNYELEPNKVKFFFNYMEFTDTELGEMLDSGEGASTSWISVTVPPDLVVNQNYGKGELWARLRNVLRQRKYLG